MVPALVASAIGGVIAIALSLPLRSPDDVFFNSASVALGALLAGIAGGSAWTATRGNVARFAGVLGAAFVLVALGAVAAETMLARMTMWAVPLAAVILASVAALTPLLARRRVPGGAGAAVVPMLALGFALMGRGDAEVQALQLPATTPTSVAAAPSGTSTPAASPAASATAAASAAPGAAGAGFRTPADVRGVVFTIGSGSRSQFTVREKLAQLPLPNDAVMQNAALTGQLRLDGASTVQLDLRQFSSDQPRRDNFIRQMWSRQPTATVTIDNIGALPAQYVGGEVVKRQVSGRLAIFGNEAPIALDIEARLNGDTLEILGRTKFTWADYRIPPPNTPTVQVQDEVSVEVLLVAKATR